MDELIPHSHRSQRIRRFPFYPVLLYVGLIAALVVADRLARRSGIEAQSMALAFLLLIPACLAGARALEVALRWRFYSARPREILRVQGGGAAMYGALPPAILFSIPLTSWLGIPFGLFWDIALVAVLVGMIPTRLGCFGAGCCAGRATASRFALRSRNARGLAMRRHPVPLFEALLGAALLCLSLALWERLPFPGAVALFIAAGYGAGRFALDGLREERAPELAGIGAYRWISAALFVIGVAGLAAGTLVADAATIERHALAEGSGGVLHLVVSGLLLLPIVHLFRFLGCDVVFGLDVPRGVRHLLQMLVIVPDLGTGPVAARMQFLREPDMTEISESPVVLEDAGAQPDGRLRFEKVTELPEGAYTVVCTVSRTGAVTRVGTCSGELNAPALVVAFNAENNSAPNVLQPRLCFETL